MVSGLAPPMIPTATATARLPLSAYLQVSLAATAWGTWSLFLRPAGVDARWSAAIMLAVVALAAAPTLLRPGARGPVEGGPRAPREWRAIALLGLFDAGNAVLFFAAMSVTTVAIAVLSHYLAPVLVAAAAPTVLGTPRAPRATGLAVVALFGLALVLEPWRLSAGASGHAALGALLGAGSAVFYAGNVLVTKRVGPRFTAEELLVYHSVISAVLLAALAVAVSAPFPSGAGATRVALASVFVGALAGLSFLYGLRRMPAEHAGILTFLEPLTAVVVAWIAWNERPGGAAALGGALVLGAGIVAIRGRPSPAVVAARSTTA